MPENHPHDYAKTLNQIERAGSRGIRGEQREFLPLFPASARRELEVWLDRGSEGGGGDVLFAPQQLLALQKLALSYGERGEPNSFQEGQRAHDFILLAAQVTDVAEDFSGLVQRGVLSQTAAFTEERRALYMLRKGYVTEPTFYRAIAGRAYQLWLNSRIQWPAGLETPEEYCQRLFSVRLSRFISVILAPTFLLLRSRQTTPPDGVFDPNRFFRDTRIPTEQALKVLAHQTHPGSAGHSAHSASTYWAFEDLRAKPYLRASSNLLVPNALSFAFQRATTGIFWMLHSDNLGHVHDFTGHFGKMFEDYCLRLVESIERREVLRVTGPVVYRRGGNTVESSDIIVSALGSYRAIRIFVECGAIRPSLSVLRDGDLSEFRKYVDRIVGKLTQLHERIEDHRAGLFELGDELPSGALYCPVLVIDEPFYWSKELRDILDEKVRKRNLLSGFDTTKLIICDVKDLEYLIEQTEKGNGLPDMLLAYLKEGRSAGMRQFLQERDPSLDAPSLVNAGFGDLMNMVARECYDRDLDNAL